MVLIYGEKDIGKSTLIRYLVNRALSEKESNEKIHYFDLDIGQTEFTISGCLSYIELKDPLLGPPSSHIRINPETDRTLFYGLLSPQTSSIRYLECVDYLRKMWNIENCKSPVDHPLIFINTMGWCTGELNNEFHSNNDV